MNSCLSTAPILRSRLPIVLAAASLSLLAACGGGGSDAVTAASTAPTTPAVPDAPQPYLAGSEELTAYSLLNAERGRCGFGLLTANTQLDAAARAHADYQLINNRNSHTEDPRVPEGFTGVEPESRVRFQGYTGAGGVTDEYAFYTSSSPIRSVRGLGESGVRALLNAPYHLNGLMSGYRDVGFAVRSTADVSRGANGAFVQINAAYKANVGPQQLAATDVRTYPCEGATNIGRILSNESPNPVPGRDLSTNPLGSSVYIAVREGNTLAVTNASIRDALTGQNVILRVPVTTANDPYGPCLSGCFKGNQGYIVADTPLQPGTAYTVSISGTNNGAAFNRTFTFTTGA